ncbi:MAG: hypothetical protein LBN37_05835 [Bacteroidales bacterium]|nr:hypothetical protein [Bacteroidales bacterium]
MNGRSVLFAVLIACFATLVYTAPHEKFVAAAPDAGKTAIAKSSTPPFAAILSDPQVVRCPARTVKPFSGGQNSPIPFAKTLFNKLIACKNHAIEISVETYIQSTYLPYFYDDSLAMLRRLNI